jgi:WD40 repeat protein
MRPESSRLQLVTGSLLAILFSFGCGRTQAPAAAKAAPPPPFEYVAEWGREGPAPGQLEHPAGLAVDADGNAFITDPGNNIIEKFGPDGHPLLAFEDSVPKNVRGIAVDRSSGIYAIAPHSRAIYVYKGTGELFRTMVLGLGRQTLDSVAVAGDGSIFVLVSDSRSKKSEVRKYTPRGRLTKAWRLAEAANGAEQVPASIAVGNDSCVYVADSTGQDLQKFSDNGDPISNWTWDGGSDGTAAAGNTSGSGIGITAAGIVVADPSELGVRVWTPDGKQRLIDDLGGRLQGSEEFEIAASPDGELLVLDGTHDRVLRFQMHL